MAKLGAALSYDPFKEPPIEEAKLGAPVDFDPFQQAGPPDEKELNLPPLQGTAAPGIPLPIPRPADIPLPVPRPSNLNEVAPAPATAPTAPLTGIESLPGVLDIEKQMRSVQGGATTVTAAHLQDLKDRIANGEQFPPGSEGDIMKRMAAGERFDPLTELSLNTSLIPDYKKTEAQALAGREQLGNRIENLPPTDFSKTVQEARKTGNLTDLASGVYNGILKDPLGALKDLTGTIVPGAPQVAATYLGGASGGALFGGATEFASSVVDETIKRSPNPDELRKQLLAGDTTEYDKLYAQHQKEIESEAKQAALVSGTFGGVFGLVPGAKTFLGGVAKNLGVYAPLGTAQSIIQNEITKVPDIDLDTGKPKLDANGNVILKNTEGMSTSDIAVAYGIAVASGIPFEAMHLLKGKESTPAQGTNTPSGGAETPPGGAETPPPPGGPGAGPEAAAPQPGPTTEQFNYKYNFNPRNDAHLIAGFEDDIRLGRMTREEALDRIAKMTPEEVAQNSELWRQVGGEEVNKAKLSPEDDLYLQAKRKEFDNLGEPLFKTETEQKAPGAQPSPEEPVEAQGAEPPPSPDATKTQAPIDENQASILKGAGWGIDDIMEMSPSERVAKAASAVKNKSTPSPLTDEDRAMLYGKPAPEAAAQPTPEAAAPPPPPPPPPEEASPSQRAEDLVNKGIPPLDAMKQAAAESEAAAQPKAAAPEPVSEAIPMPAPAEPSASSIQQLKEQRAKRDAEAKVEAQPTPEPAPAAPAPQPREIVAQEPALQDFVGHRYGSVNPKMLTAMVSENPNISQRIRGRTPDETGASSIKVRIDPALLPSGGKVKDAISQMPSAVKEVIVGPDAYKGMKQKDVEAFHKVLDSIEKAGGKVISVGEPPSFEKVKRSRPTRELGQFISSLGGINGINPDTGKVSKEFDNIRHRNLPGLIRVDGSGMSLQDAFQAAYDEGFYPEHKGAIESTKQAGDINERGILNQFAGDLEKTGKYRHGDEIRAQQEEAKRKDQEENELGPIREAAAKRGLKYDDQIIRDAAVLVREGRDVIDALDTAQLLHDIKVMENEVMGDVLNNDGRKELADIIGKEMFDDIDSLEKHRIDGELRPENAEPLVMEREGETNIPTAPKTGAVPREEGAAVQEPAATPEAERVGKQLEEKGVGKPTVEAGPAESAKAPVSAGKEIPGTGLSIEQKKVNLSPKQQTKKIRDLMARYFEPGKIINGYGNKDKVVSYNPPNENGSWSVTVQSITRSGELEPPRTHSTMPSNKEMREVLGSGIDKDFVVTGDLVKNKALLDKLGFEPIRTVDGVQQRVFIGPDPTEAIKVGLQPSVEAGAEGKPQTVIPGAEKIPDSELAQRRADQPMRAKAEQKEPAGLFGDLGQKDLLDIAKNKPPEPEAPKYPSWIKDAAKKIKGSIVIHHDKASETGLILVFNGKDTTPIYAAAKKAGNSVEVTRKDIDSIYTTGSNVSNKAFTPIELRNLKAAKKEFLVKDKAAYDADPNGPFVGGSQLVVSKSIKPEIAGVFTQWAKMMGIDTKIYLTAPEDVLTGTFHGPYRSIYASAASDNSHTARIMPGVHYITINSHSRISKVLETLAHEMGHVLEKEYFRNLPKATQDAIKAEHTKWLASTKGMTAQEFINSLRTHTTAKITKITNPDNVIRSLPPYWEKFGEWFADQTARWANSEAKPQSVIEKFFKRLAEALKQFYSSIAGSKWLPTKTMRDFLNERANAADNPAQGMDMQSESIRPDDMDYSFNSFDPETVDEINKANEANGMNRGAKKAVAKSFEEPKEGVFGKIRRDIQDEFIYQYSVEKAIEQSKGAPLPDELGVYMMTNLMPGKVAEGMTDIQNKEAIPLFDKMKKMKISLSELGVYAYAKAAIERNQIIAARNLNMPDGGSGLMTKTALDIIKNVESGNRASEFKELLKDVHDIRDRDTARRVEAGLISQVDADALQKAEPNHSPLFGFSERDASDDMTFNTSNMNVGKGIGITPSEWKAATGRTSIADNPVINTILRAQEGIYRIEKNFVGETLYKLAKENPNPDLWVINKPIMKKIIDENGFVAWKLDTMITPNTVVLKSGGKPIFIRLNNEALAESFKRLGINKQGEMLKMWKGVNQYYSQLQTGKNLDFMSKNISRDVADAFVYSFIKDPKVSARFVINWLPAITTAVRVEMGIASKRQLELYDQWRHAGGKLSHYNGQELEQVANRLQKIAGYADPVTWRTLPEKAIAPLWKLLNVIPNMMGKLNEPFEQATRIAVFKSAVDSGYSDAQAALMARDSTVNFNRRGRVSVSDYKWFFNAALQPTFMWGRMLKTKRGAAVFTSLLGLGFANAIRNMAMSDDDKMQKGRKNYMAIPEWEKQGNIIIKTGPGPKDYYKIPIGSQLNLPFYLGSQFALALTGQATGAEAASNALSGAFWSAMPITSGPLAQMLLPSIIGPAVDLWYNQNWMGSPIHPPETNWNKGLVKAEQESKNTTPIYSEFTKWLNTSAGGNSAQPSGTFTDLYPDNIQHIADFLVGGAGRSVEGVSKLVANLISGIPTKMEDMPIVKSFVPSKWDASPRYYELHNLAVEAENQGRKAVADYEKNPTAANSRVMNKILTPLGAYNEDGKVHWTDSAPIMAMREADLKLKGIRQQRLIDKDNSNLTPAVRQQKLDDADKKANDIMIEAGKSMSSLGIRPIKGPLSSMIEKPPSR